TTDPPVTTAGRRGPRWRDTSSTTRWPGCVTATTTTTAIATTVVADPAPHERTPGERAGIPARPHRARSRLSWTRRVGGIEQAVHGPRRIPRVGLLRPLKATSPGLP